MKAVILAAGSATRMRPLTDERPKCLLPLNGKSILERTIDSITAAGVEHIGLVIGFKAEMLRSFVKSRFPFHKIRFIVNPKYETTNNAFSLLMSREFFLSTPGAAAPSDELLLLDADILFAPPMIRFLIAHGSPNKIAVRVEGAHDDEEVRVKVDADGSLLSIGKSGAMAEAFGESVGIEVFSPSSAGRMYEILEERVRAGPGRTEFYEAAFQVLIDEGYKLAAVDVSSFPSIEIDTPEDLRAAEDLASRSGF